MDRSWIQDLVGLFGTVLMLINKVKGTLVNLTMNMIVSGREKIIDVEKE